LGYAVKKIFVLVFFLGRFITPSAGNAQEADSLVSICFTGDVTFANHFEHYVGKRYTYPFARLSILREADLAMVNLENPLTRARHGRAKQYVFRARPDYWRVLKYGGIDIVNLANNHIYDYGAQGLLETIAILDSVGIQHVGAGKNMKEARRPVIIQKKGIRIAFLAYYGLRPHSGCHPAQKDSAGTALRYLNFIRQDIGKIRNKVDYILVTFHWGLEKEHYPQKEQIYVAHKTIDYGADAIIGHHPHVLQGIEKYKNRIIAYSLGNFIFGGNSRTYEESIILRLFLRGSHKPAIKAECIPIKIKYWQPSLLNAAGSKALGDSLRKYSSVFKQSIF